MDYFENKMKGHEYYEMARCCAFGWGVKKDPEKALELCEKAAEQGYARAQYSLAVCHARGDGVEKDPGKAVEWYEKAAEQGHEASQNYLAACYESGWIVNGNDASI